MKVFNQDDTVLNGLEPIENFFVIILYVIYSNQNLPVSIVVDVNFSRMVAKEKIYFENVRKVDVNDVMKKVRVFVSMSERVDYENFEELV